MAGTEKERECRRGLDGVHEMLARGTDDDGKPLDSGLRREIKELLFACHYGTPGCGWKPKKEKST